MTIHVAVLTQSVGVTGRQTDRHNGCSGLHSTPGHLLLCDMSETLVHGGGSTEQIQWQQTTIDSDGRKITITWRMLSDARTCSHQ